MTRPEALLVDGRAELRRAWALDEEDDAGPEIRERLARAAELAEAAWDESAEGSPVEAAAQALLREVVRAEEALLVGWDS